MREIDAASLMSRQYAISPSGAPLPKNENDDAWLPDLSLSKPSATTTEVQQSAINQNRLKDNEQQNSQNNDQQNQPDQASADQSTNIPNASNVQNNVTQNQQDHYLVAQSIQSFDPGFQVQDSSFSLEKVPNVPPISNDSLLNQYDDQSFLPLNNSNQENSVDNSFKTDLSLLPNDLPTPENLLLPQDSNAETENDNSSLIIEDIRVSGLEMSTSRFNRLIKTKIGNNFNQQTLEEDKRAILQTKQFIDVTVSTTTDSKKPGTIVVNFDLTPRRIMQYIKVIGNRRISKTEILEELGMKRGETRMDPYDVETGKLRIIELYKGKNYNDPHVEILQGDRPEDIGVIYLIDEGLKQKVLRTIFVGNTAASSARLRNLVANKPGFFYFIGGDFSRERLDEDVNKLLEYYRKLGYFDARIDREYEEGEGYSGLGKENAWITVRYIINEGRQYRVRNFYFNGNKVIPSSRLAEILKVKSGDIYNQNAIEGDRIALKMEYDNLGYALSDIEPTRIYTEDEGFLDIRYNIKEDRRFRVRDIKIAYEGGEARTKTNVVLNMIDLAPGQLLKGQDIRNSETTLRRSGIFNDKVDQGIIPTIAIVPDENVLPIEEKTAKKPEENKIRGQFISQSDQDKQFLNQYSTEKPQNESAQNCSSPKIVEDQNNSDNRNYLDYRYDNKNKHNQNNLNNINHYNNTNHCNNIKMQNNDQNVQIDQSGDSRFFDFSERNWLNQNPQESQAQFIRGQMRQVPTSFGNTTTQGSPYSNYNNAQSNSNSTLPSVTNLTNSSYSDTSMYNNSAIIYNDGLQNSNATNQANAVAEAPFLNNQVGFAQSGSTKQQNDNNGTISNPALVASAPGFNALGAAGRDAVFPGTKEQEYYQNSLFGNGQLTAQNTISDADVIARIKETRTGLIQAQVGVNSDYGLVGNFSITERNFDIMKWPTAIWRADGWTDAFRGAGQTFQLQAAPGTELSRYSASWDIPYVFNTKNCFGVTALYGDRDYTEWFETRVGGEIRLGRQWTPRFSTSIISSAYSIKIKDPIATFVPDLNAVLGTNAMYSVGLSASYDTRNHPFIPSQGYVITGSVEQSFGDFVFPRANVDARFYRTLHKRQDETGRWILGLRSAAGWLGDDAPIYERFYGGGSTNLRGFEYREVTPRYANTFVGIGGNFEFYNSAELLIPLSGGDEFHLAMFVDSGTISKNLKDWDTYRVAPGLGVRISIPMLGPAPLALDFAFPVSKGAMDVTQVFSFTLSALR
ncbi:MAG: BamA/TamA family outer membrane protein [Planctomycetia bacterium]|nr:BamA/TamA family outer membrane protein [Planctomycetia bacterium]